MKIEPYPPISPDHFEKMCREWCEIILAEESGVWIWPVLNAPYRRIWQFQGNKKLQRKLLGNNSNSHLLIHVDLEQKEKLSKNDFYECLTDALVTQSGIVLKKDLSGLILLDELIKRKKIINLFVTGIDTSIKVRNWEAIDELSSLAQRNWETHVILITEVDITHKDYFPSFNKRSTLAQNITITSLYTYEDTKAFVKYISYNWKVVLTKLQEQWIYDNCGGHFLLSKDVIRSVRKNPKISPDEISKSVSLILRAESIYSNFSLEEKKVLSYVVSRQLVPPSFNHSKEFLIKQNWLEQSHGMIGLTVPYLNRFVLKYKELSDIGKNQQNYLIFSSQELKIFEYLKSNVNKILPREKIAEVMWDEDWEDKYSEWAIDQTMHRIRTKLRSLKSPYELRTKKGVGFILLSK